MLQSSWTANIYKKIRNENTGKKIERRAWCQYRRARIIGLFFSRASVFVSWVKNSEHVILHDLSSWREWGMESSPSEGLASLFLLILRVSSGCEPEGCTWVLSDASTPVYFQHNNNNNPLYTRHHSRGFHQNAKTHTWWQNTSDIFLPTFKIIWSISCI